MPTILAADPDACYRAVHSRDPRFDGRFVSAVRTTRIYCRPSCPARTPARRNVEFFVTAAAAQRAGFRACKRCLPDASPGSPEWDLAGDVAGRAMRMIADGVVDREGVQGLAQRLGYTSRHLSRVLTDRLGAGPLALARAHRVQTARVLLTATDLPLTEIAFASGFSSVRQFNQSVREVYDTTPTALRGRRDQSVSAPGALSLRLAVRTPYDGERLLAFLAARTVTGVERVEEGTYGRVMDLPGGPGLVTVRPPTDVSQAETAFATATFTLTDLRDVTAAVERVRRLLDADCDAAAVADQLGADRVLGGWVRARPGIRVPGQVSGEEVAVRAVVGQHVSVRSARATASRLVADYGSSVAFGVDELTRTFPRSDVLAGLDPDRLPLPATRARALVDLCCQLADRRIRLDRSQERAEVRDHLLRIKGIGPWTADYIALRALGDPDVFLPGDLVIRRALRDRAVAAADWRPWRSYALMYLWSHGEDA